MAGISSATDQADEGLEAVLADYLRSAEEGRAPDRMELLARHPELAPELAAFFAGQDHFGRLAAPLREAVSAVQESTIEDKLAQGGRLGDFRIVCEIGRGGMGVVYEAEQISLGRKVALKVLPFAATLDQRQLQRFKNESLAAAQLDHPHIVDVYGVGTDRGVHYYAMRLVDGQTLARVIADLRLKILDVQNQAVEGASAPPSSPKDSTATIPYVPQLAPQSEDHNSKVENSTAVALTTDHSIKSAEFFRKVAEMGQYIAEALHQGHEQGIIHRDIKPSNLMLDGRGKVWVTDFGLAHVQGDKSLTMTGDLVGTLRYMSPEQALAKRVVVDQRTDIYSLGATLYELLALQPAYGANDRQELLRQIAFEEPRPPRRVNKSIPPELETIVLKALEKNPDDRYATAKALAEDLVRFLKDEPIRARRPTSLQKAKKWARRHRPVVWATAVVLLVVAVMSGGVGLWWVQKRAGAQGEARAALKEATELQKDEYWVEALSAARRAQAVLVGVWANRDLRQQADEMAKDLEMAHRLEEARLQGTAQKDGHFDSEASAAAYAQAFAWYGLDVDSLDPQDAGERIRSRPIGVQLAASLDIWAVVRRRTNGDWRHLFAIARAVDSDPWRNRLRDAMERNEPEIFEEIFRFDPGSDLSPATAGLLADFDFQTTAAVQRVVILQRIQQRHPDDFWVNQNLATCLTKMQPPRLEEAIRYYTAAVGLRPKSPGAHLNLGATLADKGLLDQAIGEFREAIRLKQDFVQAHLLLGRALKETGRLDEAIAERQETIRLFEQVRRKQEQTLGPDHSDTLRTLHDLAEAYFDAGQLPEAIHLLEQVHEKRQRSLGPDHQNTVATLNNLGVAYLNVGRVPEAIRALEQVHENRQRNLGPDHPDTLTPLANLASAYQDAGRLAEAIRLLEEVRRKKEQALGPDHAGTLRTLNNLAAAYWLAGKLDRSVPLFEELLPRRQAKLGNDHAETFQAAFNLGVNYRDAGRLDDAVRIFDEWLPRAEAKFQPLQDRLPLALGMAAETYERAGRFDRAIMLRRAAVADARHALSASDPRLAAALASLGLNLLGAKQPAEAEKVLRECLAIREKKEEDVWTTFNAKSMLGGALVGQKKYAEAEPLLLQGYEGMRQREAKILAPGKLRPTEALERLVQLYDAWGKPEQAAQWRTKLEAQKLKTSPQPPPKEEKKDLPQRTQKSQSKN